jgi:hypothetical protein
VIGPGRLTITFTRAARIGNPSAPGVYALRIVKGKLAFPARFVVKR